MRTLWDRLRDKIWLRVDWYSCELTQHAKTYVEDMDVHFRRMRSNDLEKMLRNFPKELSERKYNILKDRLTEEGKAVFVAETQEDDSPAGFFCASVIATYVGGIKETLHVPAGTVYLFDDYVFEKYRGKHIHRKSVCYRLHEYCNLGFTRALVCIYHTNYTSAQSYRNNGFQYDHSDVRIIPLGYKFSKTY